MRRRSETLRRVVIALLFLLPSTILSCGSRSDVSVEGVAPVNPVHTADAGSTRDARALDVTVDSEDGAIDAGPGLPDVSPPLNDAPADDAPLESGDAPDANPVLAPPRLLAPLSTATVTSQNPLLRWVLVSGEDGAEIDICRDRACTTRVTTFRVVGDRATLPVTLTQGVYFWRARGTAGSAVGISNSAVWEMFVGVRSAPQGASWGSTLDVNGDGFADVMVGAPSTSGSTESVYLYLGSVSGLGATPSTWSYTGHPNGNYRDPIASAGDVDGDGFADVLIGVPDPAAKTGAVLVYRGGAGGLSMSPTRLPAPNGVDASFGWVVASAGDVNGDGYADVLIGAPSGKGGVFVYYGSATGLSSAQTVLLSAVVPSGDTAYFGRAVAGAGDLDADGFADVVLGADEGRYAFVFNGSAAGLGTTPTILAAPHYPDPPDQNPAFGSSVTCAGDVNADGFADLLIGAQGDGNGYDDTGSAYLFFGGAHGLSVPPIPLANPTANSGAAFGAFVGAAGDIDGDGYGDMLAATDTNSYVYLGGPSGPRAQPFMLVVPGGSQSFTFGQAALAAGGDVNGDGFADVLAGSPDSNNWAGGAYLYLGSVRGPGAPLPLAHPAVANGFFGASLASAVRAPRIGGRAVRLL